MLSSWRNVRVAFLLQVAIVCLVVIVLAALSFFGLR